MGRLAGFKYRDVVSKLKKLGFQFDRNAAGSHEIWYNPHNKKRVTVPNHSGDMPEGTVRAILKAGDIEVNIFLETK